MGGNNIKNSQGVDSILGNPKKALWKMSIPLIISLFITSLYSVIDAIWVSGLGADALAGVGFVSPIFIALMGIGNGLGAGSASALSKYIGEDNKEKADNGAVHSVFITVIVSVVTTIVLLIFLRDILLSIGAGSTIDYAMDYGMLLVLGSILVILSNALYGVLRGEGDANRTMYAMLFSSILNMALDPVFIYGLNLGIKGAAIATLISLLLVNLILFYWFYIKKDTYLKPFLSNYKFDKGISIDIIKVGFPASLELINNALFAALFSLLLVAVANTDAVAVYSTGWRVVTIATTPILAIATALISVVGANYGARRYEEILVAHRYSMKIAIIFGFAAICSRHSGLCICPSNSFSVCIYRHKYKIDSTAYCIPISDSNLFPNNGLWMHFNIRFSRYWEWNNCNVPDNLKGNSFHSCICNTFSYCIRLWRIWCLVGDNPWRDCCKHNHNDLGRFAY